MATKFKKTFSTLFAFCSIISVVCYAKENLNIGAMANIGFTKSIVSSGHAEVRAPETQSMEYIQITAGNVNVVIYENPYGTLEITPSSLTTSGCVNFELDKLDIDIPKDAPFTEIVVMLPEGRKYSLEVQTQADIYLCASSIIEAKLTNLTGHIFIFDSSIESAYINSLRGDIDIRESYIQLLRTNTASGDTYINSIVTSAIVESRTGSIEYYTPVLFSNADFKTMSGDIEMEIPDKTGFEVFFDSIEGSFYCSEEFELEEHSGKYVYLSGNTPINVKTASGDLILMKW
ncbi:MAG: DUF4097 domain-containing protein [Eubacteriaceae bacterium]|nr:DUF4097 domain-containing protein [Eubacteriaceae bacterium]